MQSGINLLRDLDLAGVKWELAAQGADQSGKWKVESGNGDESKAKSTSCANIHSTLSTFHSNTVPPVAPMSKDMAAATAANADTIESLIAAINDFNHPLKQFAKNVVRPHIAKNDSGLLIITDMPGADDDNCGNILTGAAGELMDKMLNAIGLSRDTVSILPLIFWRTPGGRSASIEELSLAKPFVNRAIELLQPKIVLTLGTLAASEIANAKLPSDHGKIFPLSAFRFPLSALPIYHPNYLLLKPDAKRDVWNVLQNLQNILKTA